jgi:hypothetical protein
MQNGTDNEDRYFGLEGLAQYSGLSIRTLRRYMKDPLNPLPNHHVHSGGKDRGRVLISKRAFDRWVETFPALHETQRPTSSPKTVEDYTAHWKRRLALK